MLKKELSFKALVIVTLAMKMELAQSVCNVFPKIFGEETSNITFSDMDINEFTDTLVSIG
jgi:hypothetical protein